MEFITALWMPIVLSAVAVWMASAAAWMFIGHHKKDFIGLPNEDAFIDAVRSMGIPPGNYGFPYAEGRSCNNNPEFMAKWERGPAGMVNVWPKVSMGRNMVLTFINYLVVSTIIAYLGHGLLPEGTEFMPVFRTLGTAGILAYGFAFIPGMVWFNAYPRAIVMSIIDGIVYGLITGAIFAALWPKLTIALPVG